MYMCGYGNSYESAAGGFARPAAFGRRQNERFPVRVDDGGDGGENVQVPLEVEAECPRKWSLYFAWPLPARRRRGGSRLREHHFKFFRQLHLAAIRQLKN